MTPRDLLVRRRPPQVRLAYGAASAGSAAPAASAAGSDAQPAAARHLMVPTSVTEDGVAVAAVATAALEQLCGWSAEDLRAELERVGHRGETASTSELRAPGDATVTAVGVGAGSARDLRRAGAAIGRQLRGSKPTTVVVLGLPPLPGADSAAGGVPAALRDLVEGALLGAHQQLKLTDREAATADSQLLVVLDEVGGRAAGAERTRAASQEAVRRAEVVARAAWRARDLANLPSSVKDPAWVAEAATLLAGEAGLQVRVRGMAELEAEGFGGILAVGRGSVREPRLVELTYDPGAAAGTDAAAAPQGRGRRGRRPRHVVLVGKGITFDTGGLSLKRPYDLMVAMKTDMAASGAVLAVLAALPELGVTDRVTGLLALAENMPGADAARPGDVITHFGGRTSEVLNTDAEGRLVLADAISYAGAELDPDVVVDLATLTGAATLGLGKRHAPLYTTDPALGRELEAASARSGDQVWPMPLVEDYRSALDSDVADISNVPRDHTVMGGSITAALFLREFATATPWAHLDIAGTGRAEADEHEISKGATGFGVRLLCEWLAPR